MALRAAASKALDLLYPPRCVHCGRFGVLLCTECAATLQPATGEGRCPFCSASWHGSLNCPRCMDLSHLEGVRAAFEMEGAARAVVHGLKYEGIRALAQTMASSLGSVAHDRVDAAFAVPLHRSRIKNRGFNQSELVLEALAWPRGLGELRRVRKTKTQVGMHLGERRTNVSGAFDYSGPKLTGLSIGVIDDVVTTGATANECAAVLREHGARRVFAFAFARASYNPDAPASPISD